MSFNEFRERVFNLKLLRHEKNIINPYLYDFIARHFWAGKKRV